MMTSLQNKIAARLSPLHNLDDLRAALLADLEWLAETLLGPPSSRTPQTWRWERGAASLSKCAAATVARGTHTKQARAEAPCK